MMTDLAPGLDALAGGIVVSCQAGPDSPLNSPAMIAALAASAERGGAVGFRVDGVENIKAVRGISSLPIIGINKQPHVGFDVFITPTAQSAVDVAVAGSQIVAVDGTARPRPGGGSFTQIVRALHEVDAQVMADVATADEGLRALDAGADVAATTLAGYTEYSTDKGEPAFDVLQAIVARGGRVIVEGRIWTVEHVANAFELGAFAVVIGSAVTVPEFITRRFVAAAGRVEQQA
ncbi:MAG TPA: putative N-acetylmannosamine-6-phosphate 2-epimerase [Propionicimonas sp.]|jgi:N-acylglucosamine-6-phosphate 2-epimerase